MTKAQERRIEGLKRRCEQELMLGRTDRYEFKTFEVTTIYEKVISLKVITGMKNDEGTMAEVFGREQFLIFIGPRGGVTYYDHNSKSIKRKSWDGGSLYTLTRAY